MDNFDFYVERVRFDLLQENRLHFIGWFKDDNPKNRTIEVYVNKQLVEVTYSKEKSIAIRQKYLDWRANISEEVRGTLELPVQLEEVKCLEIYSCLANEKKLVKKVNGNVLRKKRFEHPHYIESESIENDKLVMSGWALGCEEITYALYQNGQPVEFELQRGYRRDVMAVFEEADPAYLAGFKITAQVKGKSGIKLQLTSDGKTTECTVGKVASAMNANNAQKAMWWLKNYGVKLTTQKIYAKLSGKDFVGGKDKAEAEYQEWMKKYDITAEEIEAQRKVAFNLQPKLSIVIPLYATKIPYLKELIDSIKLQTYENWELCLADGTGIDSPLKAVVEEYIKEDARIKYQLLNSNDGISANTNAAIEMATGEYIVLCDHDDIVPANALYECVKAINENPSTDVIYSDEDKIDMKGKKRFAPHFKSDFNIDLLCSMNYICHLFVVKTSLVEELKQRDGAVLRKEFDGAQDHDFILRCCELAKHIKHIPLILYHWRCHIDSTAANPESKLYAFEAGRKAVEEHYKRCGIPASVSHGAFYGMFTTTYHWDEQPLISIIIPNKDHIDDLQTIMKSIDEKSTYRNYEFVIVENNSTQEETFAFYKTIETRENVQVLYYDGDFNFSRINNYGAKHAKGEYLLLLNNDTEIINPDCLSEMLGYCMREDVGIVGARLYYQDDTIQHAGVVVGFGGIAGHTFIGSSRYDNGYFARIICAQDYSAVTAACMMTKKSVFDAVGGLTEELKVAFNDIDYCLKVRELGKLVVYNPAVELYHYESKSRGMEDTPEKVERFNSEVDRFANRWGDVLDAGDPYYNPNLTLFKADFSLKE